MLIPTSKRIINEVTIALEITTKIIPPSFSKVFDEFFKEGVILAIKDPIHAVG